MTNNRLNIVPAARGVAFLLVALHVALSLHAARHLSPTWDEVVYPVAGFVQWRTHALSVPTGHPFLAQLGIAFPLLFLKPSLPPLQGGSVEAFHLGFDFLFRNHVPATQLLFWSRFSSVVFSTCTLTLLFLWMESLWGSWGGLISVACYAATPILCSRACAALLEMPMLFFGLLSLYAHWKWMRERKPVMLRLCGLAFGLSLLCKLVVLPLGFCFLFLEWLPSFNAVPLRERAGASLQLFGTAALVLAVAFLPWHGGTAAALFTFKNLFIFNKSFPFFWHGHSWEHAPSLLSWAAWLIKAPLFVLIASVWGAMAWHRSKKHRLAFYHLGLFGLAAFASVLVLHSAVNTIQLVPVGLLCAGLAAACAGAPTKTPRNVLIGVLLAAALADTWRIHPNYLAYFSPAVGGASQGYRWLSDSDQDWGQSLPALTRYWEKRHRPSLLLAYSGAGDPSARGLIYQDFLSPALVSRVSAGQRIIETSGPLLLVVGTKVLQTEPAMEWLFKNLEPSAMPDPCFFVFDIGENEKALRWVADLYAQTNRPEQARWALERARRLALEGVLS